MFRHAVAAAVVVATIQAAPARAEMVQWSSAAGGNDHWYEVVEAPGISWTAAQAAAQAVGGYLASIESAEEDGFVQGLLNAVTPAAQYRDHYWIGGTDEGSERSFRWVDPSASWGYENWHGGEPNNVQYWDDEQRPYFENYVAYDFRDQWRWNDAPNELGELVRGYVVERNGAPLSSIPEPASLTLLAIGGLAAIRARRRRA